MTVGLLHSDVNIGDHGRLLKFTSSTAYSGENVVFLLNAHNFKKQWDQVLGEACDNSEQVCKEMIEARVERTNILWRRRGEALVLLPAEDSKPLVTGIQHASVRRKYSSIERDTLDAMTCLLVGKPGISQYVVS